jgi:nucleotide-binding universal stress UspA family protein
MRNKLEVLVHGESYWTEAFGPLPEYRKWHDDYHDASTEALRLMRAMLERGDGRCPVRVVEEGVGTVIEYCEHYDGDDIMMMSYMGTDNKGTPYFGAIRVPRTPPKPPARPTP